MRWSRTIKEAAPRSERRTWNRSNGRGASDGDSTSRDQDFRSHGPYEHLLAIKGTGASRPAWEATETDETIAISAGEPMGNRGRTGTSRARSSSWENGDFYGSWGGAAREEVKVEYRLIDGRGAAAADSFRVRLRPVTEAGATGNASPWSIRGDLRCYGEATGSKTEWGIKEGGIVSMGTLLTMSGVDRRG